MLINTTPILYNSSYYINENNQNNIIPCFDILTCDINTKYYFPPPQTIVSEYQYQDVNKNEYLRYSVMKFFNNKILSWFKNDNNKINFYKSKEGSQKLFDIIKKFVHKYKYNWYDLIDNYKLVKKYIYKHG